MKGRRDLEAPDISSTKAALKLEGSKWTGADCFPLGLTSSFCTDDSFLTDDWKVSELK